MLVMTSNDERSGAFLSEPRCQIRGKDPQFLEEPSLELCYASSLFEVPYLILNCYLKEMDCELYKHMIFLDCRLQL